MAIYRNVHINFWEDSKILDDMAIEERYFMLYLLTNPHTNQIGCFEISKRQMKNETDFETKKINELLEKFEKELDLIIYCSKTKELYVKNWYKYNWSKSPKVRKCIEKEFLKIKNDTLKEDIYKKLIKIYGIDTVSIHYANGIYSLCIKEEKEEEEEKEKEKKEEREATHVASHPPLFTLSEVLKYGKEKDASEEYCEKFYKYYTKTKKKKWASIEEWQNKFDEWYAEDKENDKETKIIKLGEGVFKI